MRNETVQAWLLGKLVHEGLDAPPTGADRNAMDTPWLKTQKNPRSQRFARFSYMNRGVTLFY